MDAQYLQKVGFKMAVVLLLIGAVNWLLVGLFNYNPIDLLLGKRFSRVIYIVVGVAALAIAFNRDTYLPFLGETVMPCGAIQERTPPGASTQISVNVPPNSKILYWAAEPATEHLKTIPTWKEAYLGFENAGVTTSDSNGVATFKVRNPQPYSVPWKGRIESHIHFRICQGNGFLSRVKTVFLEDGHVEGFLV